MEYSKQFQSQIKLVAFDLDGTLTQHKEPLTPENKAVLDELSKKYKLLMVGAGQCRRIFNQMNGYPVDIIGNYGMQQCRYDEKIKDIVTVEDKSIPCDRESVDERITALREKYGFTEFRGDNTEFHPSGCVTFPILGTKAIQADKLNFDPDRKKRRAIYDDVVKTFPDFRVFVGGSSSFDMAPAPFDKAYALKKYADEHGLAPTNIVYVGDDYGLGGNDESVFKGDFFTLKNDDYRLLRETVKDLL